MIVLRSLKLHKVIIDIECNSLVNPTKIWVIVCRNLDTDEVSIFREVTSNDAERQRFLAFAATVTHWVGHNWLDYDWPVLRDLLQLDIPEVAEHSTDTLIISRLVDYSRSNVARTSQVPRASDQGGASGSAGGSASSEATSDTPPDRQRPKKLGHSLESYGLEFSLPKGKNYYLDFFKHWSQELEDYCVRDTEICGRIYGKYHHIISNPNWRPAILLEHQFQLIINDLHNNGFHFNVAKANGLLSKVEADLAVLNQKIAAAFPPRERLIREFTPKLTKFGTISRTSVPRTLWTNIATYEAGQTYQHTRLEPFNPSSHKQVIQVLIEAKWSPTDKTQTHIDTEREL